MGKAVIEIERGVQGHEGDISVLTRLVTITHT